MKKYKQIYFFYFGYGEQDFIPCEYCGNEAVDVHHLDNKGMGGSKSKDYIGNLMGLCRECHNKAHSYVKFNNKLKEIHKSKL